MPSGAPVKKLKLVIILNTIPEVLSLYFYLRGFGLSCSPFISPAARSRQPELDHAISEDETCLTAELSEYLTPYCLLAGLSDYDGEAFPFGDEPCLRLMKRDSDARQGKSAGRRGCPFFGICNGPKMIRDCLDSDIVITNSHAILLTRAAGVNAKGVTSRLYFEHMLDSCDLAIFDECDWTQIIFDEMMMPSGKLHGDYVSPEADITHEYQMRSPQEAEGAPEEETRFLSLLNIFVTVVDRLNESLRRCDPYWPIIGVGRFFWTRSLLDHVFLEKKLIDDKLYRRLCSAVQNSRPDNNATLDSNICSVFSPEYPERFEAEFERWIARLRRYYLVTDEDGRRKLDDFLMLIMRMIAFERYFRQLESAREERDRVLPGDERINDLRRIMVRRSSRLLEYGPSALCGAFLGICRRQDGDISIMRPLAYGGAFLTDSPWMRVARDGRPLGPHVLLLSGTSWAPGSWQYHVPRAVNYILEAPIPAREFLAKSVFIAPMIPSIRVSGQPAQKKDYQLSKLAKAYWSVIADETSHGKVLLITNSYDQADTIRKTLEKMGSRGSWPDIGICTIGPAEAASYDDPFSRTITRSETGRFPDMEARILIAPAATIARGRNIVDDLGNAALGSVFLMVRPLAVPDDPLALRAKVNGYMRERLNRKPGESIVAHGKRTYQLANTKMNWFARNRYTSFS